MARTVRTKVYKFDELSESAKGKAIKSLYDINVDYDWSELIIEEEQDELTELGFENAKIMFSGFSSQGDGACFTCSHVDLHKFMDGKYKEYSTIIDCSIAHSWNYYFATSTSVNIDLIDNIGDEDFNEIEIAICSERERLGNEIYKKLEKAFDYLSSEAAIIETIQANDYEFTQEGKLYS